MLYICSINELKNKIMDVTISLDKQNITPTEEKFIKRAMLGHQQIQEGKCKDSEEVFKILEERYK